MKAAGVIEDKADRTWEAKIEQLRKNKERSRNFNVLFTDAALGDWVAKQKRCFKSKKCNNNQDPNGSKAPNNNKNNHWYQYQFQKELSQSFDFVTPLWNNHLHKLPTKFTHSRHGDPY